MPTVVLLLAAAWAASACLPLPEDLALPRDGTDKVALERPCVVDASQLLEYKESVKYDRQWPAGGAPVPQRRLTMQERAFYVSRNKAPVFVLGVMKGATCVKHDVFGSGAGQE